MEPRITVITIGVDDLEKSLKFYRDGLGLKTDGIIGEEFEYGAVVCFDLQNGVKLALWPRKSISHDSGLPLQRPSATEFTLGDTACGTIREGVRHDRNRIDEAYEKHVNLIGKHHNAHFPAGFPELKMAMIENHVSNELFAEAISKARTRASARSCLNS